MENTSCPVCGLEQILDKQARCPQCDADLSCFNVLDEIPDEFPAQESRSRSVLPLVLVAAVAIAAAIIALLGHDSVGELELKLVSQNALFQDEKENNAKTVEELEAKIRNLSVPVKPAEKEPTGPEPKMPEAPIDEETVIK